MPSRCPYSVTTRRLQHSNCRVRDPRTELATLTAALITACGSLARELKGGSPPELSIGRFAQAIPYAAPVTKVGAGQ